MDLFTQIDDALAIVRMPKGVLKQTKVYSRGDRVFVPHSGGFIRVTAQFGDTFGTSHPDIKVVELSQDVPGLFVTGEPRFRPAPAVRAAA